jgi:preprotein translocase subunit YajC
MTTLYPGLAALMAAGSSSSTKASSASSLAGLLPLVLIGVLAWLLFFRPRSQQAKRQRQDLMTLEVGDEVLTGAGIFGTVVDLEDDRVVLETAPGSRVTVLRSTIARRLTEPPVYDDEVERHEDHEDQDWGGSAHDEGGTDHGGGWAQNGNGNEGHDDGAGAESAGGGG